MKASKSFEYHVDGNRLSKIEAGSDIPSVAVDYAKKNGYCEKVETKQSPKPQNKARTAPQNKAK